MDLDFIKDLIIKLETRNYLEEQRTKFNLIYIAMSYKIKRKRSPVQISYWGKFCWADEIQERRFVWVSEVFCGRVERICIRKVGWLIAVAVHYRGPKQKAKQSLKLIYTKFGCHPIMKVQKLWLISGVGGWGRVKLGKIERWLSVSWDKARPWQRNS